MGISGHIRSAIVARAGVNGYVTGLLFRPIGNRRIMRLTFGQFRAKTGIPSLQSHNTPVSSYFLTLLQKKQHSDITVDKPVNEGYTGGIS